ncbi:MAG: hypothetical protein ACRES7_04275 [Gammaproteobacteria bacterium]
MKTRTITATTGLSVLTSGLASAVGLCCFATWVVPLLGVTGAIWFARLGPYRPYFIGAAALLLVVGLWGAFRARKTCAADARKRRRLVWLNVFLALGVVVLIVSVFAVQLGVLLDRVLS